LVVEDITEVETVVLVDIRDVVAMLG
jgi:hypothetical protein